MRSAVQVDLTRGNTLNFDVSEGGKKEVDQLDVMYIHIQKYNVNVIYNSFTKSSHKDDFTPKYFIFSPKLF